MNETVLNILRAAEAQAKHDLIRAQQKVSLAQEDLTKAQADKKQAEQRISDIQQTLKG